MRRLHQMIRPYVVGTDGEIGGYTFLTDGVAEFDQALTDLLDHVSARQTAVREYLQSIR
jgi:spore coat protein H